MADLNKYLGNVKLRDQRDRIRQADEDELRGLLDDLSRELLNLRTQAMVQGLPNPMRINHARKLIARINTELSAREKKAA